MIPFVSVIIPVYNAEKYLRACLDSVVAQSLREIEIICVDDGSTDASPAVLAEYAARDPRVRVITQENAGVGPARNVGIRAARGEFVAFIDPDDLLPDESAYEALYLWAKEKRVRVCGGGVCSLANDGRRYFPDASWGSNVDQAFPRDGFMRFAEWQFDYGFYRYIFERRLLLDNEIFFPPYIRYQDPVFCARALEAAGTFYALRRPTYVFRDWHSPDYTDPRRVCDQLRGVRDLLKFSRERGRAKLHWLQIHRLFEEFKPHVLALVKREKSGEHVPADQSAIALLKEIDASVSFPLAWQHKADYPFRFLREEFGIQDCFPPVPDAPFPQDTVDCAFITDDGYVNMTAVAINSIRRSRAPETKVRIHVVAAALSEYSEKVFKLFEEKDFSVEIIRVEKAVLDKLATLHKAKERGYCMATPAALLKFSLPELLPNLNRVLYLDGDVLVRRDLGELFRTPLGENYAAAVTDPWVATDDTDLIRALERNYFNSGMMLLNLKQMREKNISEELFKEKKRTTDFRLMDQPILNRVLAGRTKILPLRFNVCPYWWLSRLWKLRKPEGFEFAKKIFGESLSGVEDLIPQNSVLLHFAGVKKPWTSTGIPFEEEWDACARDFRDKILAAIESKFLPVPSPLVSIVVPVYNVESFLPQCLNSLVKQSCSEIEVICVDDGSTDSSAKILEKYAALYPEKICIVTQENQGLSAARNAGQSAARGEYIMYVDSDDYLAPDACEKMLSAMLSDDDLAFVMCQTELVWDFDAAEEHRRGKARYFSITPGVRKTEPDELISVPVVLWGKLFRRKTIAGKKVQCPPGLKNEDEYFMPVYVECSPETRFSILPDKLYFYRQRKDSIMGKIQVSPVKSFSPDYFVGLEMLGNFFAGRGVFEKWRNYFEVKLNRALAQQKGKDPLWAGNFFDRLRRKFLENSEVIDEHSPLVSVVVPVFNTAPYLRECLDLICGQTLRNIEIICVNDGSTDNSLSILEEYAARDSRVRVFSQENFGQGHARNVGLAHARGEYVYFMDSDDCLPLAALQKEYACAKASELDVLLFEGSSVYETKEQEERFPVYKELYLRKGNYPGVLSGTQIAVLLNKNRAAFVSPCCFLSKREFLAQNKLRFPEGYFYEDNVFFFALLKAAERVSVVHEKLFVRRVREGSTMTKPVGSRNFLGYAHVIAELEKLAREGTDDGFKKVLLDTSAWMSRAIAGYYEAFSLEDRARSRELLAGVLKDSAWLDGARERVAEIDAGGKEEIRVDSRESAVKPSGKSAGKAASRLPRFVVRLGAAFILNKAARKRWRERHMDLTPRDGIDVNAHPELRRDSALKRFAVRAASLFIFSKKKRKAFRARHLNLTPRDGVDVRALSSWELARLREAKRSRSALRRVFDALVPATRGKIAHAERHLLRAAEEQTRILLDELRRVREDAAETRRELARLREEQERSREELLLRTLALKRVARDAEENLQARLEQVSERMKTALERGKIDKIAKTADRMEAWLDYSLLGDALPGFREKLRESIPTASRESLDELFRTGTDSPCVADCRNRLAARIRSAFSYKDAAYYERVPVAERERELKLWFKLRSGCDLDLENPKTFNEKIQWLKLYDSTPLKTRLADKYEARAWIKEKIGEKYLVPLLGVWDSFDEIDFDKLPEKFVLKTTHGSGYNVVVKDKSKFDKADAKKKITDWLSRKFEYQGGFEMHYAGIKPRVIAEEFLDIDESGAYEWQAFCFNGKPKFILVIEGGAHAGVPGRRYYYDTNWKKLPFTSLADSLPEGEIEMPERFAEFMDCAKKLAADFLHVRVDFYLLRDGSWKAGELTFTTASGQMRIYPKSYDRVIGDMLELPTDRP